MTAAITVAEYNVHLQTTDTSMDTFKTDAIAKAQSMAEAMGVVFAAGTLTERYTVRPGQQTIQLRKYPVTSVTSIKCYFGSGASDYNTLSTDSYYVNLTSGLISIVGAGRQSLVAVLDAQGYAIDPVVIGQLPTFSPGIDNHEIVYVAGATAPDWLKQCLFEATDYLFNNAGVNPRVQSESIGSFSQSFMATSKLPSSTAAIARIFAQAQTGAFLL